MLHLVGVSASVSDDNALRQGICPFCHPAAAVPQVLLQLSSAYVCVICNVTSAWSCSIRACYMQCHLSMAHAPDLEHPLCDPTA